MAEPDDEARGPILQLRFYRSHSGAEPVRDWLKSLPKDDRKSVGEDIKTAQYGWPIGMPLVRKLEPSLWEVRSHTTSGTARVIFTVSKALMVLLHGFVKKSQKTPQDELATARRRLLHLKQEKSE